MRDRCHHYEEEGKNLIDLIISQMNNKRLSTNQAARVDTVFLQTEIDKLLNGLSHRAKRDVRRKNLNKIIK